MRGPTEPRMSTQITKKVPSVGPLVFFGLWPALPFFLLHAPAVLSTGVMTMLSDRIHVHLWKEHQNSMIKRQPVLTKLYLHCVFHLTLSISVYRKYSPTPFRFSLHSFSSWSRVGCGPNTVKIIRHQKFRKSSFPCPREQLFRTISGFSSPFYCSLH